MFPDSLFDKTLENLRSSGSMPLRLELWNGRRIDLSRQPRVKIAIPDRRALKYFVSPDLNKLGEAFVEGHINVEGPIEDVFKVAEQLSRKAAGKRQIGLFHGGRHFRHDDRKDIEYHYDVSNDFYELFLDHSMVYSCGYYRNDSDSLDQAQENKMDHILRKLRLKRGERFLDIGCGWGALILRAAGKFGASATGVTLSKRQFEYAKSRIAGSGLQDRCKVELLDYRDIPGEGIFDKIASVGMFEHVGLKNLSTYFAKIRSLLKDDGLVLNHGITSSDVDGKWTGLGGGEFIDRYVFPNGELPHISLVLREISKTGMEVIDVESLRRHYAKTCREWARRLEKNHGAAVAIAGEKRFRIWEIYLAGCAFGFDHSWINLYQVLASVPNAQGCSSQPMTRDYMYDGESQNPKAA